MEYLIEVLGSRPLRFRFSLFQPDGSDTTAFVPRVLRPLGYFVRASVRTLGGETVFSTTEPKQKPKLRPESEDSYLELGPGYSYGAVLEGDAFEGPGGPYLLSIQYSNREYVGTEARPVGTLHYETTVDLPVDDD
jgi:hypothetical protein